MYHFIATEISIKKQYKAVIGGVVPRPIARVAILNNDEVYNIATYNYFGRSSNELPLLKIAVLRVNAEMKDIACNILNTKEAVVHVVDTNSSESMN